MYQRNRLDTPFIKNFKVLMKRTDLNQTEKNVFCAIVNMAQEKEIGFPKVETIMNALGITCRRTASRAISSLEDKQLIEVNKRGNKNEYHIKYHNMTNEVDKVTESHEVQLWDKNAYALLSHTSSDKKTYALLSHTSCAFMSHSPMLLCLTGLCFYVSYPTYPKLNSTAQPSPESYLKKLPTRIYKRNCIRRENYEEKNTNCKTQISFYIHLESPLASLGFVALSSLPLSMSASSGSNEVMKKRSTQKLANEVSQSSLNTISGSTVLKNKKEAVEAKAEVARAEPEKLHVVPLKPEAPKPMIEAPKQEAPKQEARPSPTPFARGEFWQRIHDIVEEERKTESARFIASGFFLVLTLMKYVPPCKSEDELQDAIESVMEGAEEVVRYVKERFQCRRVGYDGFLFCTLHFARGIEDELPIGEYLRGGEWTFQDVLEFFKTDEWLEGYLDSNRGNRLQERTCIDEGIDFRYEELAKKKYIQRQLLHVKEEGLENEEVESVRKRLNDESFLLALRSFGTQADFTKYIQMKLEYAAARLGVPFDRERYMTGIEVFLAEFDRVPDLSDRVLRIDKAFELFERDRNNPFSVEVWQQKEYSGMWTLQSMVEFMDMFRARENIFTLHELGEMTFAERCEKENEALEARRREVDEMKRREEEAKTK